MQRMPKRPKRNKRFWQHVYTLMSRFPAAFEVAVVVAHDVPKEYRPAWAVTVKHGKSFEVWIQEPSVHDWSPHPGKMSYIEQFMFDAFLHEYAHVLDWSHLRDKFEASYAQFHSGTWGVWYAKLYQSLTEDP